MPFPIHHNRPSICIWPRETPKPHDAPELDLVPRLQVRDETAFREVVDPCMSRIYRAAFGSFRGIGCIRRGENLRPKNRAAIPR
jgi:hypothetical protein